MKALHRILAALVLAACAPLVLAQAFPSRPVKIVVSFPPGGSADVLARILAPKLTEIWSQPVVIENKPGASANIGTEFVAKSPPDGYTLLLAALALAVSAAVFPNLGYDALRDLAPLALLPVFEAYWSCIRRCPPLRRRNVRHASQPGSSTSLDRLTRRSLARAPAARDGHRARCLQGFRAGGAGDACRRGAGDDDDARRRHAARQERQTARTCRDFGSAHRVPA
jgi:hypothetical protein